MASAKDLQNSYINWLKKEIVFTDVENGYISLSTPFLDTNYDNIEIFAKFLSNSQILLTDFGETLFKLEDAGIKINKRSKNIYKIFEQVLQDFGITFNNDSSLSITTDVDLFPIAKNRLLQAIMRINDLLYLKDNKKQNSFNDLITKFFISNDILFTPSLEITGQNGTSSHFDFSLPAPAGKERLIKTVTRPNDINQAKIFNFDVRETSQVRREAKYSLVLNDIEKSFKNQMKINALTGLDSTEANVIGFKEIKDNPSLLSA